VVAELRRCLHFAFTAFVVRFLSHHQLLPNRESLATHLQVLLLLLLLLLLFSADHIYTHTHTYTLSRCRMRATLRQLQLRASCDGVTLLQTVRVPLVALRRPLLTPSPSPPFSDRSRFYLCARRAYSTDRESKSGLESSTTISDDATDLLWNTLEDGQPFPTDATPVGASPDHTEADTASSKTHPSLQRDDADGRDKGIPESEGTCEHSRGMTENASPAAPEYVWVALHNMPRSWLHEDIIQLIHHVAQHAGITPPSSSHDLAHDQQNNVEVAEDKDDEDDDGAISRVTSPFVLHLHIPFGRRTGLVYGTPKLQLSSAALATYLTDHLTFDADDFRNRVFFTKLTPAELPSGFRQQQQGEEQPAGEGDGGPAQMPAGHARVRYTPVEETIEHEQAEALRTLELDRYLFAPDLLLDIVKSHQRRLVTRNEKVLLDAFVDGDEDADDDDDGDDDDEHSSNKTEEEEEEEDVAEAEAGARRRTSSLSRRRRRRAGGSGGGGASMKSTKRRTKVRAGTQRHLGRGSMHNMPIPKPYVEGRRL
jgi:hypothetical protein